MPTSLSTTVAEYQAGFRPSRLCVEQIFNLKTIIKLHVIRSKHITCTFVDFRKAYDSLIDNHYFTSSKKRARQ